MPQPNDYSGAFAPVEPSQALLSGIQSGVGLQNLRVQQQQQQAALTAQQARSDAFARLASNPNRTADDWAQAMTLMPDMSEHFKRAWEVQNTAQQQATVGEMSQVAAALMLGKPEAAAAILTNRIKALENGGPPDQLQGAKSMLAMIQADPKFALGMTMAKLRANPAAKDVVENIVKLNKDARDEAAAPAELRQKEADAKKAEVGAKFAEVGALLDLKEKGWRITAIQEDIDIKKQANRIAAMNAATAREGNALKREELTLQIQAARQKLDDAVRTKAADIESARSSIDNLINTADKILGVHKKDPGTVESAHGPLSSRMPTASQSTADYEAMVETLGSQTFIAQIPAMKGTGALSEREGDKLQASLQSLSLKQSPASMKAAVEEVQRLMLKSRKNLTTRYGVPETVPDTPAVDASPAAIDALVKQYTGSSTVSPKPRN